MSDDDDDRARKDNTGKEHKPEQARDNQNALRGSVGTERTFGPSLGMGGSRQRQDNTWAAQQTQNRKEPEKSQADDNTLPELDPKKPITIKTDIPQYDKELAKDHNVITRAQAERLLGKDAVAQKFYDEPGTGAAQGNGPEDATDADKQKAQEFFDQMKKQRDRDKGHGR